MTNDILEIELRDRSRSSQTVLVNNDVTQQARLYVFCPTDFGGGRFSASCELRE
jgi:hypothetical protein